MKTDDQNPREHPGEESFSNSENIQHLPSVWQSYRWQIIAFVAIGLVAYFAYSSLLSWWNPFKPAQTSSIWKGQFTYYMGLPPFEGTLRILPHQGDAFTGTLSEPVYGNTIVSVPGTTGRSDQLYQQQLHYVTQLYGNGTGTFITFTDLAYIQGNQIQLNCSYIAVIYADGSLHGIWFYPNDPQPDGTFILNKVS